jgi:hypothetical protein
LGILGSNSHGYHTSRRTDSRISCIVMKFLVVFSGCKVNNQCPPEVANPLFARGTVATAAENTGVSTVLLERNQPEST